MSMIQCHKQCGTLLARFDDCVQTDLALTQLDKETFEKDWKLTREIALAQKRLSIIVRWHVHRSLPRGGRKELVVGKSTFTTATTRRGYNSPVLKDCLGTLCYDAQ